MSGQDLAAAAIAALALGWLVLRRLRAKRRPTPLCGDCPGCSPSAVTHAPSGPHAPQHDGWVPVSELRFPDA